LAEYKSRQFYLPWKLFFEAVEAYLLSTQARIQVNKNLAHSDGMRVVELAKLSALGSASDGSLFELDQ